MKKNNIDVVIYTEKDSLEGKWGHVYFVLLKCCGLNFTQSSYIAIDYVRNSLQSPLHGDVVTDLVNRESMENLVQQIYKVKEQTKVCLKCFKTFRLKIFIRRALKLRQSVWWPASILTFVEGINQPLAYWLDDNQIATLIFSISYSLSLYFNCKLSLVILNEDNNTLNYGLREWPSQEL